MRIIAGARRGLRLAELGKGDEKARLRPTGDRVREALFNVLLGGRFGDPVTDAMVLDLFAGTGALGFEALSRGARHVTFVESGRNAQALIAQNTRLMRAEDAVTLLRADATRLPDAKTPPAQLVFLDPPYSKGLGALALQAATAQRWLAPDALIVWEDASAQPAPPGFRHLEDRRYGDTFVTFLRWTSDHAP